MTVDDMHVTRRDDGYRIVVDEVFDTDAADLRDAITSPGRLARWMADYRGRLALGGTWHAMARDEEWGSGTVTACDPPNGFSTTWTADGGPGSTLTVRLTPAGEGTRLHLEHEWVVDPAYGAGWAAYLGMLHDHVADGSRADLGERGFAERFAGLRDRYDPLFETAM